MEKERIIDISRLKSMKILIRKHLRKQRRRTLTKNYNSRGDKLIVERDENES